MEPHTLIINNGTKEPEALFHAFGNSHAVSWNNLNEIDILQYDLVVLSGSSNFPVMGHERDLQKELELIRLCPIPLLGICYGFELIVTAFGGTLKRLPEKEMGIREAEIIRDDEIFKGIEKLHVYEGHQWVAEAVPESLITLARSTHGIEAVKHINRPLYGFQFHPEKHLDETVGNQILDNFKSLLK